MERRKTEVRGTEVSFRDTTVVLEVWTEKIKRSQEKLRLKYQTGIRSAKSFSATLKNLDFIPQPDKRDTFQGYEQMSDSCPVYNQFSDIDSKGYTGERRKRPL